MYDSLPKIKWTILLNSIKFNSLLYFVIYSSLVFVYETNKVNHGCSLKLLGAEVVAGR